MKYLSKSESQTKKIAHQLAKKLKGGEIIYLEGNLGSGKTIFVKGLAEGLDIKQIITSPTFVLMKIYKKSQKSKIKTQSSKIKNQPIPNHNGSRNSKIKYLIHIDCYRINGPQEIENIGALEYFGRGDTIMAIEWAERIEKLIEDKKKIKIKIVNKGGNKRLITLRPYGHHIMTPHSITC